ncbi:MAG: BREX-1 system adenine-specific DNA-methyltransferase PglX [Tissierellia bacterium]|nr:BREX-1 system adenine-specific DNA-methyltransferase PglX [Tissierellia bacterium]
MDKQAIKGFSQRARRKLIEDVKQRAYKLGIMEDKILSIESFQGGFRIKDRNNGIFTEEQRRQRKKLIEEIEKKGYEQVIEEVAYTWFNRFIALRFMEVNDYLPTGVRVLSSVEKGKTEPDILSQISMLDLSLDWNKIDEIESDNSKGVVQKREEIYKHLLIKQCNQLGNIMPTVFEQISDYTELLLPDNLLGEYSVIRDLVESIEEYHWKIELEGKELELEEEKGDHGIEIIGWLYQYYISEKKDEVFADLKKNIKISKENIPAATQLFTPKWIVKYMIENSLGRLWLESHPNQKLRSKWKYYLEEAEQEEEVKEELEKLKNPNLAPEDIKLLDPAMGSGHILVYAFDVLYDIYLSEGYSERQIPNLILENNLYGLDIDDRAGQLSVFALMMKARSKSRRIFRRKIDLNLVSIQESDDIKQGDIDYFVGENEYLREDIEYLVEVFKEAKEYGSILEVKPIDFDRLEERLEEIRDEVPKMYDQGYRNVILEKLPSLIKQGKIMSGKYDVVCTNPPYMGSRGMNKKLSAFIRKNYPDTKADLFAAFMELDEHLVEKNGYMGMINQHGWMFLSSFEKYRMKMLHNRTIISMLHLGSRSFEEISGEVVQSTAFIKRNHLIEDYRGIYLRLIDFNNAQKKEIKTIEAISNSEVDYKYTSKINDFYKIPGSPIAYWVSDNLLKTFQHRSIKEYGYIGKGLDTCNQDRFERYWVEVNFERISLDNNSKVKSNFLKWYPFSKGGGFRKWYGNYWNIVNWENEGYEIRNYRNKDGSLKSRPQNIDKYFIDSITWSSISSSNLGARILEKAIFGNGSALFLSNKYILNRYYFLGLLNSKVSMEYLAFFSPTLSFNAGDLSKIPVIFASETTRKNIDKLVSNNVFITRLDWNSFETSWDFQRHPLLTHKGHATTIESAFKNWSDFAEKQFYQLKANEEELNRIFIEIYGLENELTPEVEEKDVTVSKADRERDIKSFISYAVGCMFGRYSLEEDGLIFAGGEGEDIIIPIADDDYFEEDILERFIDFVKTTFGEENLEGNLDYIAKTLGIRTRETSRGAIRRYFLKDFYKDHVRTYKKRPIYWLFDSGRQDGFKALIYMHRYNPDTIAKVRIDYLHELQKKYEGEIKHLDIIIDSDISTREKNQAKKKKEKLTKQILECREYDQAMNHMASQRIDIDLDDGVKVNYGKFQGIKIPRGEGQKPLKINLLAKI